jgi:hypothetical protein
MCPIPIQNILKLQGEEDEEKVEEVKYRDNPAIQPETHYYHVTSSELMRSRKDVVQSFPIIELT